MIRSLLLLLMYAAVTSFASADSCASEECISVQFYGEAQCPYCRRFVTEAWPAVWNDAELRQLVDYDFIPWGNAYFATDTCGKGPYNPQQRSCWYDQCIAASADDDDACFGGDVVYQHGEREGQLDIYESCVKQDFGMEAAVEFAYCCEGPKMDDDTTAKVLMTACVPAGVDPDDIHECWKTQGRALEIANAKQTPVHPGVPYVVVNGQPLDDPLSVKQAICDQLHGHGVQRPKSCAEAKSSLRRIISGVGDRLS